ncbi:hypothetical protein BKA70DRAFT_1416436 [Coprinopsis sp. MPI-PUGE-AT-0042]|nr:hypothetical protein BKA70DRAFT_1416436 [Coprinopsis sp. MPI-PUGE-AT-0042]
MPPSPSTGAYSNWQCGTRISFNGHRGTIKYVGNVDGASGSWLGIDWDDADRGKHDGSKDGKRYFTARCPHSGSFIRPSQTIRTAKSFLDAVRSKYLEELHGSGTQETIVLGSSAGAIEVEAVNMDKIRNKLARLDRLRDISLDDTEAAYADPPGAIAAASPNVRSLNLSQSLFVDWVEISRICRELVHLQRLALNRNVLVPPTDYHCLESSFNSLVEVELNGTLLPWKSVTGLISLMPSLEHLEVAFNRYTSQDFSSQIPSHPRLKSLNLDNNGLEDWRSTATTLANFPKLDKAIISFNQLMLVEELKTDDKPLPIDYLSLTSNGIADWLALERLSRWCPFLQTLSLRDTPIMSKPYARSFIISYFPVLQILDGTRISTRERVDSERLYLIELTKKQAESGISPITSFRWDELCEKHGKPQEQASKLDEDKIASRMITLNLVQVSTPPTAGMVMDTAQSTAVKVLPTMTLRSLRAKAKKAIGQRCSQIAFWTKMRDDVYVELEVSEDARTLDWIGLENDSQIIYQLR